MPAVTVQQAFDVALQHHRAGRLVEAEALYGQILSLQPNHAAALHLLGVIAHQRGQDPLAIDRIQKSVALEPNDAAAHCNLGEAFRALGKLDEAVICFRRAIGLKPDYPEAHYNLGNALKSRGRIDEAVAEYRQAVQLRPNYAEAWNNLGVVLATKGQPEDAINAYRQALQILPDSAETYTNLGNALLNLERVNEAVEAHRHAIAIKADYPEALCNLGNALRNRGELHGAVAAYRRAVELRTDYFEAWNNLGVALLEQGQPDEAAAAFRRAIQLQPQSSDVHTNYGNALSETSPIDRAVAEHHRALQNDNRTEAYSNLGNALKIQGRLDEAIAAYRQALVLDPEQPEVHSNLINTLHLHLHLSAESVTEEQRAWNRQFCRLAGPIANRHSNGPDPNRRLRVGYVSPDFRDHVVGRNLAPLFRNHDGQNFEFFCYSAVTKPDRLTEDFRGRASRWQNIVRVRDDVVAELIREDGVDILVDLSQHTASNRLPVFLSKPAPVQVSFAGYPESAGLDAIGYRISDRWMEAKASEMGDRISQFGVRNAEMDVGDSGMEDGKLKMEEDLATGAVALQRASERVHLIDSFWCYDPCGMEVAVNGLPALESGSITFGSLNNFCKVNDLVLRLWARVLGAVKDSRLILLSGFGSHRQRTVDFLAKCGVEPERIEFVVPCPRKEYLELYHRLDIALDPFPYGGHTTSLDALWMGVPVVSLAGERAVSRAGLSILSNLGLPELVAFSEDAYVEIASRLAGDVPRLEGLRRSLRSRMEGSVLMDGARFARQIEACYRVMWRHWCADAAD